MSTLSLLPITGLTSGGVHLFEGRIYFENDELLTSNNSSILDIFTMSESPLNLDSIYTMLVYMDISKLVNSYITYDHDTICTFSSSNKYWIFLNNNCIELSGMDCDLVEDAFWTSSIADLGQYEADLDLMISKLPPDDLNPLYLIEEGDISDYVSFQNNEVIIGDIPLSYDTSNVEFNNSITYFRPEPLPSEPVTFTEAISIQQRERIVKSGDIIELVIGFRDYTEEGSGPISFDDEYVTFNDDNIIFTPSDLISVIQFNNYNAMMDGATMTWGRILDVTRRLLIQVTDDIQNVLIENEQMYIFKSVYVNIEDKMLVDISSDRVVIYSISDKINEYYIKSCRMLKISNS